MTGLAPLKRHYPGGPRNAYAYTYANPREVGPPLPMQLEFWVPKGRKGGTWKLATVCHPDHGKTWRKVFAGHSHADKLAHSITRIRDVRDPFNTIARQCETYLQWARLKGLDTVSVFPSSYGQSAARPFGFTARVVDPVDYNGDTPEPETEVA